MTDIRSLGVDEARDLHAGADHYRAFVGPPGRFDLMSGAQFALLYMMGLREDHRVLDFGCGSLRLGRLLIPFLRPERYFGVEPEAWLVDEGFARELGADARALKRPRFEHNDQYRCDGFGETFDFIVAQSVFSHTGVEQTKKGLDAFAGVLAPEGLILTNWLVGEEGGFDPETSGWVYPDCVVYSPERISRMIHDAGLVGRPCPWPHHGGLTWYVLAGSLDALPSTAAMAGLGVRPLER